MKSRLFSISVLCIALVQSGPLHAETASERELKIAYLYHIMNFVTWPEHAFASQSEQIEVCLVADDQFDKAVEPLENRQIRKRRIHIQRLSALPPAPNCHLLFIQDEKDIDQTELIRAAREKNILTLGDTRSFTENGGMIGFTIHEERVRLVVNLDAIGQTELKVSAKLLEIAVSVTGQLGDRR